MGKSKQADLLRTFGEPQRVELFDEDKSNPEVWYHYGGGGELPGELIVNLDKRSGTILRMYLYLEHFSKEEVIRHFGGDYIVTRYEFCKGFEEQESAPIYETRDGQFQYIEYREQGIVAVVEDDGKVNRIIYVSEPVGALSPECKQARN